MKPVQINATNGAGWIFLAACDKGFVASVASLPHCIGDRQRVRRGGGGMTDGVGLPVSAGGKGDAKAGHQAKSHAAQPTHSGLMVNPKLPPG